MMAPDKVKHFVGGAVIAMLVFAIAVWAGAVAAPAAVLGVAAASAVGWWKEYHYDAKRPENHVVDKKDFYATAAGGLAGSAIAAGITVAGGFNVLH